MTMTTTTPDRPLSVLYLNPTGALGGAERCLLDVLASLRAAKPDWRLRLIVGDDGPFRTAAAAIGVRAEVLELPKALAGVGDSGIRGAGMFLGFATRAPGVALSTATYVKRLRASLRDDPPDLVQTNGMKAHVLGTGAALPGTPVVWQLQDFVGSRPVMVRLLRQLAKNRVRVVAASKAVAADASAVLGPRVPVETVYSAIDLDRFAPGPGDGPALDALAHLEPAPPGAVRVGLVATYAHWKGHGVFLDAASRVARDLPARFFVVGGPIYRSAGSQLNHDELRVKAGHLGLLNGGRVGFVGHQDDPAGVFRALDVVVHASTRPEPFGRVIVEGMASGRAVIASLAGGAAELFEDGETALGCPPCDPDALASAITRLVNDPALRQRLGEAGRASAVARFDRARLAGEWGRVYESEILTTQGRG